MAENKSISGSVDISRNARVGGNADIKGYAQFHHNVKVDGWLEAKNIKAANKGIFSSTTELESEYPSPRNGWFAGVIDIGSEEVAPDSQLTDLYVAYNGSWIKRGVLHVDVDLSAIRTLTEAVDSLGSDVLDNTTEITAVKQSISEQRSQLGELTETVSSNHTELTEAVSSVRTDLTEAVSLVRTDLTEALDSNSAELTTLQARLLALIGQNATDAIDNANEIIAFLEGFKDDEKLATKLVEIGESVNNVAEYTQDLQAQIRVNTLSRLKLVKQLGEIQATDIDSIIFSHEKYHDRIYKIMLGNSCVGWLMSELWSNGSNGQYDSSLETACAIGQTIFTTLSFNDGILTTTSHRDGEYNIMRRVLSLRDDIKVKGTNERLYVSQASKWYPIAGSIYDQERKLKEANVDNSLSALNDSITETNAKICNIGLLPFSGQVYSRDELSDKALGTVWYVVSENSFLQATGKEPILASNYNTTDRVGSPLGARTDCIYRKGSDLYYSSDGHTISLLNDKSLSGKWQELLDSLAGQDALVNINEVCPEESSLGGFYSLGTALKALKDYEVAEGVVYRKKNLIITYRTADGMSESKQYQGDSLNPEEFYLENAWCDFGKGSVASIAVDGQLVTPDRDGVVNITIPDPVIDTNLDEASLKAISNSAVATEFNESKQVNITNIEIDGNEDDGYKLKTFNASGVETGSIDLPALGGGSSEVTESAKIVLNVQITDGSDATVSTIREGSTAILKYIFGHQYATGDNAGQETGADGTLAITIKSGLIKTFEATYPGVNAGPYELNITNYLRNGNNSVTIQATVIDPLTNTEKRKQVTQKITVRHLSLSSSYDMQDSIRGGGYRQNDVAVIPFSCVASGKKDINVIIDGNFAPASSLTDYSGTNGEIRIPMAQYSPGRHNVQIYATQSLSGLELQSETIYIDLLKAPSAGFIEEPFIGAKITLQPGTVFMGNAWQVPVISTPQYATFAFEFAVIDPNNIPALVEVRHRGVLSQTVSANRTSQSYTNRFTTFGQDELSLTCGVTTYTINVDVQESRLDLNEVSDSVVLDLNASGRSNSEHNPGQWSYGDISSTFSGFDWLDDGSGWSSNGHLRLLNGARVSVNSALLSRNATTTGMTIEVELRCSNIIDRAGSVIDCMGTDNVGVKITAEEAIARMDGGETVATKFVAGEWLRIVFAVEKASSARRLLSLYVNGIHDRTARFDAASAMYNTKRSIDITSDAADVEIRRIRVYNRCLTSDEILDNYIAGRIDTDEMMVLFDRNNVLNTDKDDVDIEKMRQFGKGVLRIVGSAVDRLTDLNYRNDKSFQMRVGLEYYSPFGREYDFRANDALIQIQGTSSVTYPRKNYNILFDEQTQLYVDGVLSADNKYSFKPGARPVSIFCLKADFCDSSSTHNTGACKTINDLYKRCGWLTPPQSAYNGSYDVRVGIDSFPITLYNDNEGTGASSFIGKYNFNNDKKGSGIVYGFEGIEGYNDIATLNGTPNPCICLEFLENGHAIGLFQTDDLSNFDKALEFRFPTRDDGSKLKWANATDAQKAAIQRLWTWVRSCEGDAEKFQRELSDYFLHDAPFVQYVLSDYFMAVDDRVKNMMLVSWDGIHWMFIPYDWDCLFGVDNTSHLRYAYDIDENTYDESLSNFAFAGHGSLLWNLVRACPAKLNSVAASIRANLSVSAVKAAFSSEYDNAWCENVYNKDEEYKYIQPAFVDIEQQSGEVYGDYLFALQGNRKSHRNYMIENRFALLDSLYGIGDFRGNAQKVYLRGEFASDPRNIKITAFEKFGFGYGSNNADLSGKVVASAKGDEVTLVVNSNLSANDPQNIYGADRIEKLDMSDIADKLVSTLNLSSCKRLRDLDLTNDGNDALEVLDVSGCRILRSIHLNGMNGVKTLDLRNNRKLEALVADETALTSVNFGTGAIVSKAALPASIQSLVLIALPNLALSEDGLSAASWENVVMLQAEQLGAINPVQLLHVILADQDTHDKYRLTRVKISGISVRGDGSELLTLLDRGVVGVTNAEKPEVNGTYLLDRLIEDNDVQRIVEGIDGITVEIIIEAYISVINAVNGESYGGATEVSEVNTSNVAEHLLYYNGETYADYLARYERDNMSIHDLIRI